MDKSIIKNYIFNSTYQILNVIVPIITTPYVSRVLQVENIGNISYTSSIVTYFGVLGLLGSGTYGQLKIARERDDKTLLSKSFLEIFSCRVFSMTLSMILYTILVLSTKKYFELYLTLFLYLLAQLFDIGWFYQGLEKFKTIVIKSIFVKMITVILVFAFVKRKSDILLYVVIINGSILMGNLSLWISLRKNINFERHTQLNIIDNLKQSFIFFIPSIATIIFVSLDKCMIGWITGSAAENGYYEQANKIYSLIISFITSLTVVILPRLTYLWRDFKKNEKEIKKVIAVSITFISLIAFPTSIGLYCVCPKFINIFLGDGYEKCIPIVKTFCFIIICTSFNSIISNQCIVASGRQGLYNKLVLISSCINILSNICLIPFLDAQGAVYASAISEFVLLCLLLIICRGMIDLKVYLLFSIKYMSFALLMGICILSFDRLCQWNELIKFAFEIALGIGIYITELILSKDKLFYKYIVDSLRFRYSNI